MRETFVAIVLLALFAPVAAVADATISLPLEGYYRPGRYFPVAVTNPSEQPITLQAVGALPTLFDHGHTDGLITPMLSIGADAEEIEVDGTVQKQTLKALQSREALIGIVGGAVQQAAAKKLIPGLHSLLVQLDPTHPLVGPPLAWQSLDAVVFSQWPGGLSLEALPALLAGGMTVAVTSTSPPDQILPWRPFSGGWALRPNVAGPQGCDGNEDAYVQSGMWHPDLSIVDRRRIVAAGILVMLAVSMTLVLPHRWSVAVLAAVVVGVIVLPTVEKRTFQSVGDVQVRRAGWEQSDRWSTFAGPTNSLSHFSIESAAWPVFYEPSQAEQLHCLLIDRSELSLQFELPADHRLAIVQRMIRPTTQSANATGVDLVSPMARLARSLYGDAGLPHGAVGYGDLPAAAPDDPHPIWPTVICGP